MGRKYSQHVLSCGSKVTVQWRMPMSRCSILPINFFLVSTVQKSLALSNPKSSNFKSLDYIAHDFCLVSNCLSSCLKLPTLQGLYSKITTLGWQQALALGHHSSLFSSHSVRKRERQRRRWRQIPLLAFSS